MNAETNAKSGKMSAKQIEMFGTRSDATRTKGRPRLNPDSDGHLRQVGRRVRCIACDEPATLVRTTDHTEDYWFCPSCYAVGSASRKVDA